MERKSTSKMANPAGVRAIIAIAFSGFIELMQPKNLLEMIKEMKTVLKDSRWMLPILLSIILLDMPVIIALISWIYVIFKTRFINKEEEILFKTFTGPIYKTRIVWMKVLSLSACFCVAKFGVEIFHFLTWLMDDSTGPILSVVFEMIIKWLAFIQYFTFYRVYLYVWKAIGSYLNPMIQRKMNSQPKSKDTNADNSQKKNN